MIKLVELHKIYNTKGFGTHALKGVTLYLERGEMVAICGKSGCGKTTLMNIIGGLDRPSSGDMAIDGKLVSKFSDAEWDNFRNHKIGFVFQSYNLINHISVLDNVCLTGKIAGLNKTKTVVKAKEILTKVGLEEHMHKMPSQLSGGERQRVAIARALLNDPDIILADEPTGALDTKTSREIMDLIKSISKDKLVIFVTHNVKIAEEYATRIVEMVDGVVVNDSMPSDKRVVIELKKAMNKEKLSFMNAVKHSITSLKAGRLRTIFTILGLAIGICCLLVVDSAFNSRRIALQGITRRLSENQIIIANIREDDATFDGVNVYFDNTNSFDEVSYLPSIKINTTRPEEIENSDMTLESIIAMLQKNTEDAWPSPKTESGAKYFDDDLLFESKLPSAPGEITISYQQAEYLAGKESKTKRKIYDGLMGTTITVSYYSELDVASIFDVELKVVGILKNNKFENSIFYESDLLEFERNTSEESNGQYIAYLKEEKLKEKTDILIDLNSIEECPYMFSEYQSASSQDILASIDIFLNNFLEFVLKVVSGVTLVVGALMLLLILSISVVERKREIGLLRAMGATRFDIKKIFASETALIGFFAGITGIVMVIIITLLCNWLIPQYGIDWFTKYYSFLNAEKPLVINPAKCLLYLVFAIIIAMVAGSLPSEKAGKKCPIDALRNE